jgi:hypothetical protein
LGIWDAVVMMPDSHPVAQKSSQVLFLSCSSFFLWMIFENKFKPFIGQLLRNSWLSFVIMLRNMASESLNGL